MAWARLDDQFWSNPKIESAGNAAAGLFARALCYCSAHGTDGFVPRQIAGRLAARSRSIEGVTKAGLWLPVGPGDVFVVTGRKDSGRRKLPDVEVTIEAHGYYIRDYLHYNRARSDLRTDESADECANVQFTRASALSMSAHKDARAARPDPSPTSITPTNQSLEDPGTSDAAQVGSVGNRFGNLEPVLPEAAA